MQTIDTPSAVTPVAPSGEQYAPEWTTRVDGTGVGCSGAGVGAAGIGVGCTGVIGGAGVDVGGTFVGVGIAVGVEVGFGVGVGFGVRVAFGVGVIGSVAVAVWATNCAGLLVAVAGSAPDFVRSLTMPIATQTKSRAPQPMPIRGNLPEGSLMRCVRR